MSAFKIESFRGAFSDYEDKGLSGSFKGGKNLNVRKKIDSLSCQQALVDDLAIGVMDALPNFIVPASDGYTYFFLRNGKIYKRIPTALYSLLLVRANSQHAYISDASQTGLDITGDCTFEASIKLKSLPSTNQAFTILGKYDVGSNQRSYILEYRDSSDTERISLLYSNDGINITWVQWNNPLTINVWHKIAVVIDISEPTATQAELFINGVSEGNPDVISTDGSVTSIHNGTANFNIGARNNTGDNFFDGLIDETRIWNIKRTALQLSSNLNNELVGNESGLVAYWNFNTNALDKTSNNNDLNLSGSPDFSIDYPTGFINGAVDLYQLVYTDTNEQTTGIIGAAEWVLDTGKKYLFWATSTRLNCKEIPGSSSWSDVNALAGYPKTNLTAAPWHTMAICNGSLQICNSNTLAYVGYDGSYTNNALQLIPGNIAKCIIERGVNTIIGCYRNDNVKNSALFMWDGISDNFNDKKIIPVGSINALIDTDIPLMQVGKKGFLYYSDMSNGLPLLNFPDGGEVNPGGVTNDEGIALFGVYNNGLGKTGVYTYGKDKNNAYRVLNLDYQLDCDEIGCIAKSGDDIFVAYKTGSNIGIKKVSQTVKAVAVYESLDLKAPTLPNFEIPQWTYIILTTAPLPASTKISVKTRNDKIMTDILSEDNVDAKGWRKATLKGGTEEYTTENGNEAVFLVGTKGKISEIQITLTPHNNETPEIYRIEYFFNANNGR